MAEPMYRTIAHDLFDKIKSGIVRPGDRLPTELELRNTYNASRNTVRDAVKWLAARGLVETRPGQGTFATRRIRPFVTTLSADPRTGLSGVEGTGRLAEVHERGLGATSSVPRVEVQVAPGHIADRLHVPVGTPILTRHQEHHIDRTAWSLQTTAYPLDLVHQGATRLLAAEDIPEGTVAYLRQAIGLRQAGHRDLVLVRPPHDDESRFFRLPDDGRVAMVAIVRTGYQEGANGLVPFRVTFTVFPADRNQFVINHGDVPAGPPGPAEG